MNQPVGVDGDGAISSGHLSTAASPHKSASPHSQPPPGSRNRQIHHQSTHRLRDSPPRDSNVPTLRIAELCSRRRGHLGAV